MRTRADGPIVLPIGSKFELGVLDVGQLAESIELAPFVETLGFSRYWVSEHHGAGLIANPQLMVGILAGVTSRIRVGTGGVLLRFHSPLAVLETFRLLQLLALGRADMGIARSPADTAALNAALLDGRPTAYSSDDHAAKIAELQRLSKPLESTDPLFGHIDGAPKDLPPPELWVLSTSHEGAKIAAKLGARYAFHDFYAPTLGPDSVKRYFDEFKPSADLTAPQCTVCLDAFVADDEGTAKAVRLSHHAKENREGRRVFCGNQAQFSDHLEQMATAYQCREVLLSTLWGGGNSTAQFRSFELAKATADLLNNKTEPSPETKAGLSSKLGGDLLLRSYFSASLLPPSMQLIPPATVSVAAGVRTFRRLTLSWRAIFFMG